MFAYFRQKVLEEINREEEVSDEKVQEIIEKLLLKEGRARGLLLREREKLSKELFYALRKLDILQELIEDPGVTEIMVNGTEAVFVERNGTLFQWDRQFTSQEVLEGVVQQIVGRMNRVVNESNPIVDTRLPNGSRVNIVLPPVALNGPILTIRRFPEKAITMDDLLKFGSISREAVSFLKTLVQCGYNIFISGGTGSGKTTFLNALSNFIPQRERIITIEDSAELQIKNIPNLVRLETRNKNQEGSEEISIRDLIKSALRMRPDRIIVGEVRGGEAIDMIQCLNTGHDGSLSTGHANSSKDMLSRLETMILMGMDLPLPAIRRQIASGIDILVHLGRLRDRSRRVLEIAEVVDYVDGEIVLQPIFLFQEERNGKDGSVKGQLIKKNALCHREKLAAGGMAGENI